MTDDGTGPVGAGALLTAAREQCGMSIEDAAGKLRLSRNQLLALEAGDTASLPDVTFVRGFIRNYARLLQIDPEPLLLAYRSAMPSAHHSIALQSENIVIIGRGRRDWLPYVLGALLLLLALAWWMVYMDYRENAPAQQASAPASRQQEETSPAAVPLADIPEPTPVPELEATSPPSPTPVPALVEEPPATQTAVVAPSVPAVPAKTLARLDVVFSDQVWMSVVDGAGKVIYENTGFSGDTKLIEGVPPLKLVVGNVEGVQMTFNGKVVDLAPHARANVARFTLE